MRAKLALFIALIIISLTSYGQSWGFREGNNPFDGKYKTSWVQGIGGEFPYESPIFTINKFSLNKDKLNIYLSAVPSSVCDHNSVLIKFDDDPQLFAPKVTGSDDDEIWFLKFSNLFSFTRSQLKTLLLTDSLTLKAVDYVVPKRTYAPTIKSTEDDWIFDVLYSSNEGDTLKLINYDNESQRWLLLYFDKTDGLFKMGYAYTVNIKPYNSDQVLFGMTNQSNHMILNTWAEAVARNLKSNETELGRFLRYLKIHKKMYVRMRSDCVSADYLFSLTGSTAALNFVFK